MDKGAFKHLPQRPSTRLNSHHRVPAEPAEPAEVDESSTARDRVRDWLPQSNAAIIIIGNILIGGVVDRARIGNRFCFNISPLIAICTAITLRLPRTSRRDGLTSPLHNSGMPKTFKSKNCQYTRWESWILSMRLSSTWPNRSADPLA